MGYIFPVLIGALFVLPVLFLSNRWLRFSPAGLVMVTCLSFLFVWLLVWAQELLPLWQGALLMTVLLLCVTYILQPRASRLLFEQQEDELQSQWDLAGNEREEEQK